MNGMKKYLNINRNSAFLLLFLTLLSFSEALFAQQRQISGKVTSADGPLPGAVVKIKAKSGGTGTNNDGAFVLSAQTGDILVISSIGYKTKEVPVSTGNTVNVVLADDNQNLDEVVVVGYGVQQKKLVTGATVQVKGETLQKQSTTNALQGLQGQSPGVQITSTSGQPGEGLKVTIRGLGTIG
ncbi:MAG: carboxypeptidase-like regulatory domain-containing protein, partial [Pedobacter sp.]|nr:carboxypeptidase-like regulatory domain-containing protein [Pedobacter sp.]